ncbi:hypothetical protein BC938DRAFT_480350 [Jimgerdemannia flammicorona]|uniref:Uncharacterized protein n=1 Tax=Jimgerdemannia flammicorona TaxID=994334 RepID=A0A433QIZ1_9FUNG|nr:hypothetical protein BC938DRAFT_480350 [Jimgerdemannia flammicorona]
MTFAKNQKDKKTILNRRPFKCTGPLIVLYHKVFGQFLTNLINQNMTIPADHYKKTEAFLITASEFYQNEPQCREVVMIWKLKNELNSGSSEPVIQACLYYYGYWSQNDVCY